MKQFKRIASGASLVALVGISVSVWAHSGADMKNKETAGHGMRGGHAMQGEHGMGGMHGGRGMHGMRGESSQKFSELKAALNLTAAQLPVWDKFEQLASEQDSARRNMQESMHSGSGDHQAMRTTMIAWQKEAFAQRSAARQALYDVLTTEQRKDADRYLGSGQMLAGAGRQGSGHRH